MKKLKKLIPAFCMLLVSVAMLGTSTFAWFSMNKEVSATGMQITAKSDNVWLVINAGSSFNAANLETTATSQADETELLPVAPKAAITNATAVDYMTTASNWQYSYSNSNTAATSSGTYTECTTLTGYIASESFYIGLNEKSGATEVKNLKIKTLTLPENTGIKAVVVSEKVAVAAGDVVATTVTKTGVEVKVYYYIDGNDTNVYTDNIAKLTGTVEIEFAID